MSEASPGGWKLTGLFASIIFCVPEINAMPAYMEPGWQEARIQAVRKARDVMNRGREKKRLADQNGKEVEHAPRKRLKRQRR